MARTVQETREVIVDTARAFDLAIRGGIVGREVEAQRLLKELAIEVERLQNENERQGKQLSLTVQAALSM